MHWRCLARGIENQKGALWNSVQASPGHPLREGRERMPDMAPVNTSPRSGSPRHATSRAVLATTLSQSIGWRVVGISHMSPGDEGTVVLLWPSLTIPSLNRRSACASLRIKGRPLVPAREMFPLKSVPVVRRDRTRVHPGRLPGILHPVQTRHSTRWPRNPGDKQQIKPVKAEILSFQQSCRSPERVPIFESVSNLPDPSEPPCGAVWRNTPYSTVLQSICMEPALG